MVWNYSFLFLFYCLLVLNETTNPSTNLTNHVCETKETLSKMIYSLLFGVVGLTGLSLIIFILYFLYTSTRETYFEQNNILENLLLIRHDIAISRRIKTTAISIKCKTILFFFSEKFQSNFLLSLKRVLYISFFNC